MKKVLSLILAIVMVALLVPASMITAETVEVKAGNKNDNMVVTDGVYTVTKDDECGTYVLGESDNWEVTMTMNTTIGNAEYGLQICGKDDNGDGVILENDDSFIQVFVTNNNEIQLIGCDNGWGNVAGYGWGGNARWTGASGEVTLTVKLNGDHLSYWVGDTQCGDTIILGNNVMYGKVVSLFMKHTGTSISNVTFKDNGASTIEPELTKTATVSGATNGEASWNGNRTWVKVSKKYFEMSFTVNAAAHAGVKADNGCIGIDIGITDDTCIFIPYEGSYAAHTDTQRGIGMDDHAQVICGPWWGDSIFGGQERTNIDELVDKDVTIRVCGVANDNGTTTFSAYVNDTAIKVWGGEYTATANFDGFLGWAIRLNNVTAELKFEQSDSPIGESAPVDPVDPVDPNAAIIKVASKTVKCTDREVTLEVMLENNPGMNVLKFTPKAEISGFTYQSSKVTKGDIFDSLTKGLNPTFSYEEEDGDTKANGLVCTITFAIDEGVEAGTYRINLTNIEAINYAVEDVPYTVVAGEVTIEHGDAKEVADAKYLKSAATCSSKAVYYKSCECGAQLEATFDYGDTLDHAWAEKADAEYLNTAATCNKAATYFKSCSVCGAKGEETFEYGDPTGEHNYANLKHNADKHWYECGCGAKGEEADHEYDNACDTDCNVCGETRTTEHTWDENATEEYLKSAASCNAKAVYYKSCSVCGAKGEDTFEYGEPTGDHNYTDDWKYDESKHWHECGCGAKSDEADHAYDEGVVTTEPTTDAEGVKTFTCVCGATKTESIDKLPAPVDPPKTGTTTALAVAVALLTASTGAAVVITRKKRSI